MNDSISSPREPGQEGTRLGPRPRRRDKPQLSCVDCRRRKSRCDRNQPCGNCYTRGQICTYTDSRAHSQTSSGLGNPAHPPLAALPNLSERLDHLERLLVSLKTDSRVEIRATNLKAAHEGQASESASSKPGVATFSHEIITATPLKDDRSEAGSVTHYVASENQYTAGDHWAAVLDSIADIRNHVDRDESEVLASESPPSLLERGSFQADTGQPSRHAVAGSDVGGAMLLYGGLPATSRDELLAALPPRDAVNRYVSRYFNRLDLVASAVHGPTFLAEYEAFWQDPSTVPIAWIANLFGMICLAVLSSDTSDPIDNGIGSNFHQQTLQVRLYREKMAQCLIMAEYTRPGKYVLEALIHYIYVEFLLKPDANSDLWCLLGLEVNMATRMGYHRDPRHLSGISILQAEMRRRLWVVVLLSDILISSQMGLPRMISDRSCDTAEPRNLHDDDLSADLKELPPSRPETEYTTATALIARRRLLVVLGTICDMTASVQPIAYDEVLRVDGILHDAVSNIPPPLKIYPTLGSTIFSLTDSQQLIMARLFLTHLFHCGQLLLHQRFIRTRSDSSTETRCDYSRTKCIDAALGSLKIQQALDEETRPGGQLDTLRWRMTSLMTHHFLSATMLLCLLLHRNAAPDRNPELTTALRKARITWLRLSRAGSLEARKAAETVSIVLARLGHTTSEDSGPSVRAQPTATVAPGGTQAGETAAARQIEGMNNAGAGQISTTDAVGMVNFGPFSSDVGISFLDILTEGAETEMSIDQVMADLGLTMPQWMDESTWM